MHRRKIAGQRHQRHDLAAQRAAEAEAPERLRPLPISCSPSPLREGVGGEGSRSSPHQTPLPQPLSPPAGRGENPRGPRGITRISMKRRCTARRRHRCLNDRLGSAILNRKTRLRAPIMQSDPKAPHAAAVASIRSSKTLVGPFSIMSKASRSEMALLRSRNSQRQMGRRLCSQSMARQLE